MVESLGVFEKVGFDVHSGVDEDEGFVFGFFGRGFSGEDPPEIFWMSHHSGAMLFGDLGGAVRAAVVDDKNLESVLGVVHGHDLPKESFEVTLAVVGRNEDGVGGQARFSSTLR